MTIIRMAKAEDTEGILGIYAPIVENTPISFELEPPSLDEMQERISNTIITHPWLVCVVNGQTLGYAYASAYRARGAYAWSAETSAYVHENHHRKGVAQALYTSLLMMLKLQGYCMAYAGATLPNEASVGFHESMGYEAIGVFRQAGFKLGEWHDVGWWQRYIGNDQNVPGGPPKPVVELFGEAEWEEALQAGIDLLSL